MPALKGLDGFSYKVLLYEFASERKTITKSTLIWYVCLWCFAIAEQGIREITNVGDCNRVSDQKRLFNAWIPRQTTPRGTNTPLLLTAFSQDLNSIAAVNPCQLACDRHASAYHP